MNTNIHKKQQDTKQCDSQSNRTPPPGWLFRIGQKLNMEHMVRYK